MKKLILIILISYLASSCATIINGTSQKIKINTNTPAKIYVDGKEYNTADNTVKVSRKSNHEIKIEKEGYKTINYTFYKYMNMAWVGNVATIPLLAVGAASSSNEMLLLSLMPLPPLALYGVDFATGAAYSFDKKQDFTLVKIPEKISTEKSVPVACNGVNIKIPAGEKVGSLLDVKGNPLSSVFWQSTVNVAVDEMTVLVNNELYAFGYKVPGLSPEGNMQAKYYLNAEVTGIDYQIHSKKSRHPNTTCNLNVNWELVSRNNKKVLYTTKTTGLALKQETGGNAVILEAFNNAFYNLLNDSNLSAKLITPDKKDENKTADLTTIILNTDIKAANDLESISQSVVTIETNGGHGSGMLVSTDGYILTNNHVVDGNTEVNVEFSNGYSFIAKVIRTSEEMDVALLKIEGKGFKALSFGNSDKVKLGDDVNAIGSPGNKSLSQTVTRGIISGNRLIENKKYLQTDVSISPGNSGGPLLNKKGEVIGIITSKLAGDNIVGIGFALPMNEALKTLNIQAVKQ